MRLGALLLVACAPAPDPCEDAFLRQEAAVRACGVEVEMTRWTGDVCSTGEVLLLRCEANWLESAECATLTDGRRSGASGGYGPWTHYAFRISNCPTPW